MKTKTKTLTKAIALAALSALPVAGASAVSTSVVPSAAMDAVAFTHVLAASFICMHERGPQCHANLDVEAITVVQRHALLRGAVRSHKLEAAAKCCGRERHGHSEGLAKSAAVVSIDNVNVE